VSREESDARPFFTPSEWGCLWLVLGLIVLFVLFVYATDSTCGTIPIARACFITH
jgi:hypothetical protein